MGSKGDNNHKINPVKVPLETDQGIIESEERKWGLPLREVYKHGLSFYKGKLLLNFKISINIYLYSYRT